MLPPTFLEEKGNPTTKIPQVARKKKRIRKSHKGNSFRCCAYTCPVIFSLLVSRAFSWIDVRLKNSWESLLQPCFHPFFFDWRPETIMSHELYFYNNLQYLDCSFRKTSKEIYTFQKRFESFRKIISVRKSLPSLRSKQHSLTFDLMKNYTLYFFNREVHVSCCFAFVVRLQRLRYLFAVFSQPDEQTRFEVSILPRQLSKELCPVWTKNNPGFDPNECGPSAEDGSLIDLPVLF